MLPQDRCSGGRGFSRMRLAQWSPLVNSYGNSRMLFFSRFAMICLASYVILMFFEHWHDVVSHFTSPNLVRILISLRERSVRSPTASYTTKYQGLQSRNLENLKLCNDRRNTISLHACPFRV